MDDFKLLHRIAEGPLGPTLLVEEKSSGDKCVIKKVECRDYTQALQAYSQALQLEKIGTHSFICSYRQFFVDWDREAHAVFLCIASDYHELGNLGSFIDKQRAKKEPLDEQLLKMWVGQLAEGLCHAHNNGQLHRNIKPSNILLSPPSSLLLGTGDFAVPVAMDNLREVTERRGGTLRWLSPEELAREEGGRGGGGGGGRGRGRGGGRGGGGGGSEKSDVWSLGCVLLELATCGFMDGSHYSVFLHRLHRDPSVLEEALKQVGKFYSTEVCQLLESCLRRSLQQRPSVIELMKRPAMQLCLALARGISTDIETAPDQESEDCELPTSSSDENEEDPGYTEDSADVQSSVGYQPEGIAEGIRDILKTMQTCPNDRQSLLHYCTQLWSHTLTECGCGEVCQCGGVEVICDVLSAHMTDVQLCNVSCSLLWSLSLREKIFPELAKQGAVDLLLKCLHSHPEDSEITKYACLALGSLVRSSELLAFHVIQSESKLEGIPILMNTLNHSDCHKEAVEVVAQLLEVLCSYGDVKRELESLGAVQTLAQLHEQLVND